MYIVINIQIIKLFVLVKIAYDAVHIISVPFVVVEVRAHFRQKKKYIKNNPMYISDWKNGCIIS